MILLVPIRARFKSDIFLRERLLRKKIEEKFSFGFEVKLVGGADGDINYHREIVKNLKPYSKNSEFYLTLHCPLERNNFFSVKTDLTKKEGIVTLKKVLKLAKEINAKLVNFHTETIYFGREFIKKGFTLKKKRLLQKKVLETVVLVKEKVNFQGKITFENVPYAMMGDDPKFRTIEEMIFDPLIITAQDMLNFTLIEEEIGICLDTSHYGITKKTISESLENKNKKISCFAGRRYKNSARIK